jgi:hypothetical protein
VNLGKEPARAREPDGSHAPAPDAAAEERPRRVSAGLVARVTIHQPAVVWDPGPDDDGQPHDLIRFPDGSTLTNEHETLAWLAARKRLAAHEPTNNKPTRKSGQ